jgi:hypothetical protein
LLQPVGLVVAPPALLAAQAVPDKNIVGVQKALEAVLARPVSVYGEPELVLDDFPRFATEVLAWQPQDLAGAPDGPPLPERLAVELRDYGETLRPDFAVLDALPGLDGEARVLLLVSMVERGAELDRPAKEGKRDGWHASPQARLERLLRDCDVPAGLLCNGAELRLVYAPRGESSGHLGFPIAEMCSVGGRPILSALHMLLGEYRLLGAPDGQRLLELMAQSRKFQSEVSNRLSEQVLEALWELLRGFQAADEAAQGRVLYDLARQNPQDLYGGLLTVIMRLVFLLYAEDQGLMPDSEIYGRNYSIGGLYERLREDAGRYPDTMEQRFGAYAWLLATFRLVFDGGGHGALRLPTRHGQLFNPDEYPFLEGRPPGSLRVMGDRFEAPRVSDGVLWRVLEGLLLLDGERLSYRALDVEQIGSVYESMMGFEVQTMAGRAIALRPKHIVIELDALLAEPGGKRAAWLAEQAECKLTGSALTALKAAGSLDELVEALERRISPWTPRPLPPGALFLQPGEERRRSGSHYTPRELTEPIVRTTLRPVLEALGPRPTPEQLLALKVCDPAMGSGAFLVEACRQLAEALVEAWQRHACLPAMPPDEDPLLHARRLVAQRCLYGVDKNPFAVNLAKLSIWLVTLARDHAFSFIDHALRQGDSLVGLTRAQLGAFHWSPTADDWGPLFKGVSEAVNEASGWRRQIQALDEGDYGQRRAAWREAEDALQEARLIGDLCVAAFFGADKEKAREALRRDYLSKVEALESERRARQPRASSNGGGARARTTESNTGNADPTALQGVVEELKGGERPLRPFHWELEFPEVFAGKNGGFDAMVGNPPFLGGSSISSNHGRAYLDWVLLLHEGAHGNGDLVAHFFRRAFALLRKGGSFGLIATNTIGQGDTRSTGLRWICSNGGAIYQATRRLKWPGMAAVVVSVVHVYRGAWRRRCVLDGREVPRITAFLFHGGGHENPSTLVANAGKSFLGSKVYGQGFTFDDSDKKGLASPLAEMQRLIAKDPRNAERIFPYIGGEEVNSSPTHSHHRYVINFGELSEAEARQWPDLMAIVEAKVKPERMKLNREGYRRYWWQHGEKRSELWRAIAGLERVLVIARVGQHGVFTALPAGMVYSEQLIVFPLETHAAFCALQSRPHEIWARFFGSSMKDDLRYTPSDCFETFPFPVGWQQAPRLEAAGEAYYAFRASLMQRNGEGLTKTYNRFHDPDEGSADIQRLRELHEAMDRAVLDAYGWRDVPTACDFLLDYEIDEESWGNKRKPWRYRWPEAVHDEVLARLLALNAERHQEELAAGAQAGGAGAKGGKGRGRKGAKGKAGGTLSLFE